MTARITYEERHATRQREVTELRAKEKTISIARLLAILAAIALAFWSVAFALVPFLAFIVLVVVHERIIRRRKRAESGLAFFDRALGRLDGSWMGKGDAGNEFAEEHHPYASDFDLFGSGSLFELLSLAVTKAGRKRLATWLRTPERSAAEIRARQEAVAELREATPLREELAVQAAEVTRDIESARLEAWAAMPAIVIAPWERFVAFALPALATLLLAATLPALFAKMVGMTHAELAQSWGAVASFPIWPALLALALLAFFARRLTPRVEPVIAAVERAEPPLALLARVLARVERESFASERLSALVAKLRGERGRASVEIERLRRLVGLLDARRNQFFAPFAALLLWGVHVALAIDRWRVRSGSHIEEWIEAVGEIEALSSLAAFAYEHPTFAVPEIVTEGPLFEATALGHPLIPDDRRVTNDIRLDGTLRLLVVSGSNMSGKSTMMRSVGIAGVLAMAGAPVCAAAMRLAPTAIGASIRVHDSLQENASRFYAEILRIRQVIELSRHEPLLFLLDEMLAGTNSHDRRIGAEAIVRGLVERGAIGLVSTHDLALAQIAESLAPRAANVHFEDRIEDGKVVFDYRMRPGVVTRSNALALMRSVGIEV